MHDTRPSNETLRDHTSGTNPSINFTSQLAQKSPRLQFRWALVASDGIANKWAGTLGLLRREREGD